MAISQIGSNSMAASPTFITPNLGTPSAINLSNASALPKAALPSGTILQTVISNPSLGVIGIGTPSWTEVSSGFRVTITPTNSSSILLINCLFLFGGAFSSILSHFKIYDITNSADVNLATAVGSRTPTHGTVRQVDTDVNDTDTVGLSVSVSAASTNARTYSLYTKNESGTTQKYFFANVSDTAALTVVRPIFVIYEIAP